MKRNDKNDAELLVQKIRTQYTEKENTKLDELKQLDTKVKKPVHIFSYIFGAVGAVVMGSGMSLIMTDLGKTLGFADPFTSGCLIGLLGMLLVIANYPLYKYMLNKRRKKYADRILSISDSILEQ